MEGKGEILISISLGEVGKNGGGEVNISQPPVTRCGGVAVPRCHLISCIGGGVVCCHGRRVD